MSIELCPHCGKHYDQDFTSEDHYMDSGGYAPCMDNLIHNIKPVNPIIALAKRIYNNSIDDWAGPTKEWETCLEEAVDIIANQKDE